MSCDSAVAPRWRLSHGRRWTHIRFEQDGDVGPGAGASFGLLVGALFGALLLAPLTGLLAVGVSLDGVGNLSERDLRAGIALVAAFTSGLTALACALGGAGLGALVALLLYFGLSNRRLYAIGEDLAVGPCRPRTWMDLPADWRPAGAGRRRPDAASGA